uniref:Uncharacterized protein n=1 Tax=Anguilla anguilla TaxID=7936 RepID=A0A0E9P9X3_ANGAN
MARRPIESQLCRDLIRTRGVNAATLWKRAVGP